LKAGKPQKNHKGTSSILRASRPQEKENLVNKQAEKRSRELFHSGFYCAESVLMAIAESRHLQSDLIPRIATGFCSGMARTGGQCGAVSGAIMAINLFKGRQSPTESVEDNYALVRELMEKFAEGFGSTNCRMLLDCDLDTPEGQQTFRANQLIERCYDYAEGATWIAVSLLEERGAKDTS
jgi:C_GCAxxG_C_C family probable redox protein